MKARIVYAFFHGVPSFPKILLERSTLFVIGKGGVGKSVVSRSLAQALSTLAPSKRILWVTIEDARFKKGETTKLEPNLSHLNVDALMAFQQYAEARLKFPGLIKFFLRNALVRFLAEAAPGMHEVLVLGKIWNEIRNHDLVIVDLPSTGHGLALFQSTKNFSNLFRGGPIQRDTQSIFETLEKPNSTTFLLVSLPEELPLQETLELDVKLRELFPKADRTLVLNRVFPNLSAPGLREDEPKAIIPQTLGQYASSRFRLEENNIQKSPLRDRFQIRIPVFQADDDYGLAEKLKLFWMGLGS